MRTLVLDAKAGRRCCYIGGVPSESGGQSPNGWPISHSCLQDPRCGRPATHGLRAPEKAAS